MLVVILLLIVAVAIVYISQFNFMLVSVNLGWYTFSNIPLFYVIIASLVIGLALSYIVYVVHAISTSFKLHGKNKEIKKDKEEILELTRRIHQLELENEKLKHAPELATPVDGNAL